MVPLVFLVLFLHSCLASLCSYTASDGSFYEFTGLAKCFGYTDLSGEWTLSVCCPVGPSDEEKANVACRNNGECFGDSLVFKFAEREELTLAYGGDVGTVDYIFQCDKSKSKPTFEYISEGPIGHHTFLVRTKQACPDMAISPSSSPDIVYVYLVPHSHDDVGWLKTIDGYYESEVKHILDTVVSSLAANPNRTFIYVEQYVGLAQEYIMTTKIVLLKI
eukprot:Phypoly_transcript_14331.p1 GENE.Phypoly_transcript_14331~~Phypoly_transcript_14331.p1  ORF type:complete len:219 (-),score=21.47 Phypoly_transcript_14331:218-874(-)